MYVEVRSVTDPPNARESVRPPVTLDLRRSTLLQDVSEEAFRPSHTSDWSNQYEIWLRHSDGTFFEDCGVPWIVRPDEMLDWNQCSDEVTVGELIDTVKAGVLDAEVDVLHFSWLEGRGNGEDALLSLWPAYHPWLTMVLSAAVGVALDRAAAAIGRKWREWRHRRARPRDWMDCMLAQTKWDAHAFGKLNGLTTREAVAILMTFGYRESETVPGLYHFRPDKRASELLKRIEATDAVPWWENMSEADAERLAKDFRLPWKDDI